MWITWAWTANTKELGVVAERCPECTQPAPCLLTGRVEGINVLLFTIGLSVIDGACVCKPCSHRFPADLWRYKDPAPLAQASSLGIDALIDRTNPGLKDRLELERYLREQAVDERFTTALEASELLRFGELRTDLTKRLLQWQRLSEQERADLVKTIDELVRAQKFATSIAPRFPRTAGCLIPLLIVAAVWSAFFWFPAVRTLFWGVATAFAGFVAGACAWQLFFVWRVRRWTRSVLVEEGRKAGVDFARFLAILADLPPPGLRTFDELRHLKDQEAMFRGELLALQGSQESQGGLR